MFSDIQTQANLYTRERTQANITDPWQNIRPDSRFDKKFLSEREGFRCDFNYVPTISRHHAPSYTPMSANQRDHVYY